MERTHAFTVTLAGRTYQCERTVTGTRVLRQTIFVHGLHSVTDSARYGTKTSPVESMPGIATLIAREIIRSQS
jgi:hypothetical protein